MGATQPRNPAKSAAAWSGIVVVAAGSFIPVFQGSNQSLTAGLIVLLLQAGPWVVLGLAPLPNGTLVVWSCALIMAVANVLAILSFETGPLQDDGLAFLGLLFTLVPLGVCVVIVGAAFDYASERARGRSSPAKSRLFLVAADVGCLLAAWTWIGIGLWGTGFGGEPAAWPPFLWGPVSVVEPLWIAGALVPFVSACSLPACLETDPGRRGWLARASLVGGVITAMILVLGPLAGVALGPRNLPSVSVWIVELLLGLVTAVVIGKAVAQRRAS